MEHPNELANNLIIINNKQQPFESIENTKDMVIIANYYFV